MTLDIFEKLNIEEALEFKKKFNPCETPIEVFNEFLKTYPAFYEGDQAELNRCLDYIKSYIN